MLNFELETVMAFALASMLLSISPGPSNLYIMARTINSGQIAGFCAASGMAVGSLIFVLMTAMGLAAVFSYSPIAYTLLKLCGAGYLIYLGIQTLRQTSKVELNKKKLKPLTNARVFRQSIIVELTNPKTALFFIAFLPQFVRPDAGPVILQLILLGGLYTVIAFSSDMLVASMSNQLGKWLSTNPGFGRIQDRISGSVLLGLGSYIAFDEIERIS